MDTNHLFSLRSKMHPFLRNCSTLAVSFLRKSVTVDLWARLRQKEGSYYGNQLRNKFHFPYPSSLHLRLSRTCSVFHHTKVNHYNRLLPQQRIDIWLICWEQQFLVMFFLMRSERVVYFKTSFIWSWRLLLDGVFVTCTTQCYSTYVICYGQPLNCPWKVCNH